MITDEVIDVAGTVRVDTIHNFTYLSTNNGDFLIARCYSNVENSQIIDGKMLTGKARLWFGCAWDGELIDWVTDS